MSHTTISTDGNCPSCRGTYWKTLEALALTQRQHSSARTTGPRRSDRTDTTTATKTEAADKYARPTVTDDYDQLGRYRKWCNDSMKNAVRERAPSAGDLRALGANRKVRQAESDFATLKNLHVNGLINDEMFEKRKDELRASLSTNHVFQD